MSIVKVEQAVKNYLLGKTTVYALRGVDLTVEKGEFIAIAGPSGSGKTTLLNLIGGIEKPTSGKVFINEKELSLLNQDELADIRADKMGFIFQNFNLLPVLTAVENAEYPLNNKIISSRERKTKAEESLKQVGLWQFRNHRPMELSGGQRQRVAIARAMVIEPSLILADEPTANLDHKTGVEILNLMKKLNQEYLATFIFSTHDAKIIDMASRVVRLWDGLVQD